jgi:hypothetical protein
MTDASWVAYVGPFVALAGLVLTIWWKVEGRINSAAEKADSTDRNLAAYKLHVSETYSTKSGTREIRDEILGAVSGIRDDIRHLASRIDTMHEAASKQRPTRRSSE